MVVKPLVNFIPFTLKISIPLVCLSVVTLFIYLNRVQPHYYIDEVFHAPQTLHYCTGNFSQWDQKITTLPGLYIITTLILSPINLCNIFYMRCINLVGTFLNLYLAHSILKQISIFHWKERWCSWMKLLVGYNIMLFPPLFFWHFLYYTDVVSVNTVLLMVLLHLHKKCTAVSFIGVLSVLIRQTNIIWVAFISVEYTFDLLDQKICKSVSYQQYCSTTYVNLLWKKIIEEAQHGRKSFVKFILGLLIELIPYVLVYLSFVTFLIWNKGIVVGDKSAHIATIHITQLLYFSAFLFCFSWPYMIVYWKDYLKFVSKHWLITSCILALLTIIVRFNTLFHPYMLADNRHYVFYFFKFIRKYKMLKYLLVPIYSFTLYTMFRGIRHLRFTTQVNYILFVSVVLVPQLLLETRYFIIPYILYRFFIKKPKNWQIIAESVTTLIINFLQFYIFVSKEFYWSDQPHLQRISW